MGLPLERWARQAHIIEKYPTPDALFDDLDYLARYQQLTWKKVQRELEESGEPVAVGGPFGGLEANAPQVDLAALTGVTTETALFAAATWTPIAAGIQAPKSFHISASGTITTPATAQTMIWTPRVGTTTAGVTLGASGAAVPASTAVTSPWQLIGDLQVRGSGAAGTAVGCFQLTYGIVAAPTEAQTKTVVFGTTAATAIDFTVGQGLTIGVTPNITTISILPKLIHWVSWN